MDTIFYKRILKDWGVPVDVFPQLLGYIYRNITGEKTCFYFVQSTRLNDVQPDSGCVIITNRIEHYFLDEYQGYRIDHLNQPKFFSRSEFWEDPGYRILHVIEDDGNLRSPTNNEINGYFNCGGTNIKSKSVLFDVLIESLIQIEKLRGLPLYLAKLKVSMKSI